MPNELLEKGLLAQIARFGVVGVLATVLDYVLLMTLSQLVGVEPLAAAAISFSVSLLFNYIFSMKYVFEHREGYTTQKELSVFVALSIVGLGINQALMWAGLRVFGDSALAVTVTKGIATAIVMVWNFWSRKHWLDKTK